MATQEQFVGATSGGKALRMAVAESANLETQTHRKT